MAGVSLIEHSDWVRRQKAGDRSAHDLAVVELTRHFAAALTYYYPEYKATESVNKQALSKLRELVEQMGERLQSVAADEIILPASADLPFADVLREEVLKGTRFVLQTEEYKKDLSVLGPIDPKLPTVLDEGYRGLCDIDPELKYRWDRELRDGGQHMPPDL